MKTLNQYNLPECFVRAASSDYPPRPGRLGVTELIGPAWIRYLKLNNWQKLESDCRDGMWMMLGTAIHKILEQHAPEHWLKEFRVETEMDGWAISGVIDVIHSGGTAADIKTTTINNATGEPKPEWIAQLNVYNWINQRESSCGLLKGLEIWAICRDWNIERAEASDSYPPAPVVVVPIPIWSIENTEDYVKARLAAHADPKPCTNEEMWHRPATYAVMKKGRKTALVKTVEIDGERRGLEKSEAENFIEKEIAASPFHTKADYTLRKDPDVWARCLRYCPVSSVCEHNPYKNETHKTQP